MVPRPKPMGVHPQYHPEVRGRRFVISTVHEKGGGRSPMDDFDDRGHRSPCVNVEDIVGTFSEDGSLNAEVNIYSPESALTEVTVCRMGGAASVAEDTIAPVLEERDESDATATHWTDELASSFWCLGDCFSPNALPHKKCIPEEQTRASDETGEVLDGNSILADPEMSFASNLMSAEQGGASLDLADTDRYLTNGSEHCESIKTHVTHFPLYEGREEEESCRAIVQSLTGDQQEQAARTSYAYFLSCQSTAPSPSRRVEMAMRMARRHLVAAKGDRKVARRKLIDTLKFRKEKRIDEIRHAFSPADPSDDDRRTAFSSKIRSQLRTQSAKQKMAVRGHDKSDRAILIMFPRCSPNDPPDAEAFFNANIYMTERAMACTERATNGKREKIVVALDFSSCGRGGVSLPVLKPFVLALQRHYPERLARLVLVDAPFLLRGCWTLIKPFLHPVVQDKIKCVNGKNEKVKFLRPFISEDQAMPFLLPGGKLISDIDVKKFLEAIPFNYDYENVVDRKCNK